MPGRQAAATAAPVGRERELAMARASLDAALAGTGRLMLVGGEAGIGKTTLIDWLARQAEQQGALVVTGGCYDLSTTPPYGPWLELMRSWPDRRGLPATPSAMLDAQSLTGIHSQAALFETIATFFASAAAVTPLVLVLEDVHWADQTSLDLLRHIGRSLPGRRLLLVATYRDDELTRRHPLFELLPVVTREAGAQRIGLSRLRPNAVRDLVAGRYPLSAADTERLAGHVNRLTEGNPFFAGEVLHALVESDTLVRAGDTWRLGDLGQVHVPTLVRQVIERRLARLGADARRLLDIAAVIGHDIPLDLWVEVSGERDALLADVLERAIEARLVDELPGGERFRFSHALIRETLYDGLVSLRRRNWHRAIGDILAASARSDPDAVAHHYQRANDARAFEWLIRAGDRAQRAYALGSAIEKLAAAEALIEHDPARVGERAWLLYRIGRIGRLHRSIDPPAALAYLARASELAARSDDSILQAFLTFDSGHLQALTSDVGLGLQQMRDGLAALDALSVAEFVSRPGVAQWVADALPRHAADEHAELAGLQSVADLRRGGLVVCLGDIGHIDAALEIGVPYIARFSDQPRIVAVASSLADACIGVGLACLSRGQTQRARATLDLAARSATATDHLFTLAQVLVSTLTDITLVHDVLDLAARRTAATRISALMHHADVDATSILWLAPLRLLEGDWQELARDAGPILEATARTDPVGWRPLLLLTLWQGDGDVTEQQIQHILPHGTDTEPGAVGYVGAVDVMSVAARLALSRGTSADARAWLETRDRWVAWAGDVRSRPEGELLWAEYFQACAEPGAAARRAERAIELAGESPQPLVALAAQRLLGELDTAAGRHHEAGAWLAQSLALAGACAAPFERALTLLALAQLHAARGDAARARSDLSEARAICEALGARPTLTRVADLEARLAATAARQPRPGGLTAREVDVLRLVAQGLSDAEVAERLFLARRTVNTHLTSIYAKLNVTSRAGATRFAVEHGLA